VFWVDEIPLLKGVVVSLTKVLAYKHLGGIYPHTQRRKNR